MAKLPGGAAVIGRPQPAFEAPWHAQVFALTVSLHAAGRFTWSDWVARFGAMLKRRGLGRDLNGGDDYFAVWLETLEALLAEAHLADAAEVGVLQDAWEAAYLRTPHGQPVRLDGALG